MDRGEETLQLNRLSLDRLRQRAGNHLVLVSDLEELHRHFAASVVSRIEKNNREGRQTTLILPVGPTGQYPLMRDRINRDRVSLEATTLFFMDEYADGRGRSVDASHPLSLRGQLAWFWESIDPPLRPRAERVIFPSEENAHQLEGLIEAAGGIDVCYGGIGIHGHLAFNEPGAGVRDSGPRLVELNEFTMTMNSIRSGVGGDLENFPRRAWTLGLSQCLSARKIRLYCRNDVPGIDWANTVLRIALLGTPGDDYPVTWIRDHADWRIIADLTTAERPRRVLPRLG